MPRIIFVRPAGTDYPRQDMLLGRFDADLNEAGVQAAFQIGQALIPYQPTHLTTSPLRRAISTALAIEDATPGLTAYPANAFQAIDYGEWEARPRTLLLASDPTRFKSFLSDPDFRAPGGESMREVYARAFPELLNLVHHMEDEETLVLVLQDSVIKALSCAVLDLPLEHAHRFSMEPAAYSVFERLYHGGPYQLLAWSRHPHIENVAEQEEMLEESLAT